MTKNCICGSGLEPELCCARFIEGGDIPETAEQLMRSRFSAYASHNEDYLLASWDKNSKKKPKQIDFSKEENVEWTHLEIVGLKKGGTKDSKGIVEFKAHYLLDGEPHVMHEISRFVKKDHRWFYLDSLVKSVAKANQTLSQGKNAPCACGSGKKFKRCCGK